MNIAVLTSSRADFGIYLPLLRKLSEDCFFKLNIIAFGTHLSPIHGNTIDYIKSHNFDVKYKIESLVIGDSEESISTSMALTSLKFASFWALHKDEFDLVFCIGDRFEMFAAVSAAVPFNISFAHLHAGEKTLGAIDNIFRHAISHIAVMHFASTQQYVQRLKQMLDVSSHVYNVGALSLDNLQSMRLLTIDEFRKKWNVDFSRPTILVTFHPETIDSSRNAFFALELVEVIRKCSSNFDFLITLPNADTAGFTIRKVFSSNLSDLAGVHIVENLGTEGYFTAMKYCAFLMGNTSSGIIEAASFGKYVLNLGDRQKGRIHGANVLQIPIKKMRMIRALNSIAKLPSLNGKNIYYRGGAADKIIKILKEYHHA